MSIKMIVFCLTLCILLPCYIFANDGSYSYISSAQTGAAMPLNNKFISMTSENIQINITDLKYWPALAGESIMGSYLYGGLVITKCSFEFINNSETEQKCLMGFPVKFPASKTNYFSGNGQHVIKLLKDNFAYFDCKVKNMETEYKLVKHENNPSVPKVANYDCVYVFEVEFQPFEHIKIENLLIQDLVCNEFLSPHIEYILLSGLTWNSPIGDANIHVKFENLPSEIIKIKECNYPIKQKNSDVLEWSFSNFTPQTDLYLEFDLGISNKSAITDAFKSYSSQSDYNKIYWLNRILGDRSQIAYDDIKISSDELRLMFFDAGNYFYKNGDYLKANDMYMAGIASDKAFRDFAKKNTNRNLNRVDKYGEWLSFINSDLSYDERYIQALRDAKINTTYGTKAPLYYLLYNLACTESLTGNVKIVYLEMSLLYGYPKSEMNRLNDDSDLYLLRRVNSDELSFLFNKYK